MICPICTKQEKCASCSHFFSLIHSGNIQPKKPPPVAPKKVFIGSGEDVPFDTDDYAYFSNQETNPNSSEFRV